MKIGMLRIKKYVANMRLYSRPLRFLPKRTPPVGISVKRGSNTGAALAIPGAELLIRVPDTELPDVNISEFISYKAVPE